MNQWFGIIEILEIKTVRTASSINPEGSEALTTMKENNVRFVHYPDCQQLIIWLTHPGREYADFVLRDKNKERVKEEWPVTKHLNGSIQLLLDTLPVAPGEYIIEINWKNDWQHRIEFVKYVEGYIPEKIRVEPADEKKEKTPVPIIYKDGLGNIIEDEDLKLRDKLKEEIVSKFSRHIEYDGTFRSGTIIYADGEREIRFSHEMGGGNCMFYIDIPTENQWETQTRTPLSKRKEILEFVAATVRAEQASNCRFEINEDSIIFYYR